jgi:signal recognition particle subunit SRP54
VLFVVDAIFRKNTDKASRGIREARLTGVVLTKLDGDARGGALSASKRSPVHRPSGRYGEGDKFEEFRPEGMATARPEWATSSA